MNDLRLAVCPHDTVRNTEGWYRLAQFLSHRLGLAIHFSPSLDFDDFHHGFSSADLVYANPSDAVKLIDQHGYIPLARPAAIYDEALIVASPDLPVPALEHLRGADLAIVEGMLPTALALRLLRSEGVEPGRLIGQESWLGVVSSLWRGEQRYGVLYRDAYEELSPQGKAMVQVVAASDERAAFHILCARPDVAAEGERISAALLAMATDSEGRAVLDDIHFSGWANVAAEALSEIRKVLS